MAALPGLLRPRAWIAGALLGLILLAGIGLAIWQDGRETSHPALWRVSQGDRHAWLFGTIHAVPRGARWLSPAIEKAAAESDILVLEAAGLDTERAERQIFETLGRSPALPPIADRLPTPDRPRLTALLRDNKAALNGIDGYESWAAALLIGAAVNAGSGEQAGEARFEAMFRDSGRPVRGLETIREQLGLFDALPQSDQDAMLAQAVVQAGDAPRLFAELYQSWASGNLPALEAQFLKPLARYPRLREALVDRRNALWAQRIDTQLRAERKTLFIAVGAGHLLGPDSVEKRLQQLGWRVERMQ